MKWDKINFSEAIFVAENHKTSFSANSDVNIGKER